MVTGYANCRKQLLCAFVPLAGTIAKFNTMESLTEVLYVCRRILTSTMLWRCIIYKCTYAQTTMHGQHGCMQVEMRRYWAALLEVQVPTVDVLLMFRTAAHDIAHDDLFASVQFLGL